MLCWPQVTDGWQLQLSLCFLEFFYTISPWPCPFCPSFPTAVCPLNQSGFRFREEVNTWVLWLSPFLQRGLYNWKALVDYFKTLVGTDSHACATAGNGARSFSLAFANRCCHPLVLLFWRRGNAKASNRSVFLTMTVSCLLVGQKKKKKGDLRNCKKCRRRHWLLSRPSVLHAVL